MLSTPAASRRPQSTTTAQPSKFSADGVVCTGDDMLWPLLPEPAQAYALAWLEGIDPERLALLEEALAPDSSYADAGTVERLSGLPAISEHIGAFLSDKVGHFFRVRAWDEADQHHDYVRLRWILCRRNDATIVLEGEDILVLGESGLIRDVTRFTD